MNSSLFFFSIHRVSTAVKTKKNNVFSTAIEFDQAIWLCVCIVIEWEREREHSSHIVFDTHVHFNWLRKFRRASFNSFLVDFFCRVSLPPTSRALLLLHTYSFLQHILQLSGCVSECDNVCNIVCPTRLSSEVPKQQQQQIVAVVIVNAFIRSTIAEVATTTTSFSR